MTSTISDTLGQLRAEREGLRRRLGRLDRAIESLEALEETAPDAGSDTRSETTGTRTPRASVRSVDGTPGAILRVFAANPGRPFTIPEMHGALRASGWTSDAENQRNVVSVNLRRMHSRGQLDRTSDGRFRMPEQERSLELDQVRTDQIRDDVDGEEDWLPDETKKPKNSSTRDTNARPIGPEAFARAVLHISSDDAAEVREQADEKADSKTGRP